MHVLVYWTAQKSLVGSPGPELQPTARNGQHSLCMAQDSKDFLSPSEPVAHLSPNP